MVDARRDAARADLASPRFAPLWAAARRRLEGNGGAITSSPLVLRDLDPSQRDAVTGLLGLAPVGDGPLRARPDRIDEALRTGAAEIGLVDLLVELGGPVRDRRAERQVDRRTRDQVWADAAGHEAVARHPGLADWLAQIRSNGVATRLAGGVEGLGPLVDAALGVLARLPSDPVVLLAALADDVTGDPHALDRGRALGTLVSGALPAIGAAVSEAGDDFEWDRPSERRKEAMAAVDWRRAWSSVGVLCDDLSVSALVLNLPVGRSSSDPVVDTIYEHGLVGEPLRLTLRQVATSAIEVVEGSVVHLCENPAVVAQASMTLEDGCAPLVCVEGVPSSAVAAVLDLLVGAGSELRYHGDFDWPGIAIANGVMARWGAVPWRMAAADYRAGVARARKPLAGPVEVAAWDPDLTAAMADAGVAVHEEQVLADLLEDLAPD